MSGFSHIDGHYPRRSQHYTARWERQIQNMDNTSFLHQICRQNKIVKLKATATETVTAACAASEITDRRDIDVPDTVASLRMERSSCGLFCDVTLTGDDFCISKAMLTRRLKALPALHTSLSRDEFAGFFPKHCPGCIALNIFCAASVLGDTELVHDVLKQLLNDPLGDIIPLERVAAISRLLIKREIQALCA